MRRYAVDEEFHRIDANHGGEVLFDEFADWAIARKLDLDDDDDDDGGGAGGAGGGGGGAGGAGAGGRVPGPRAGLPSARVRPAPVQVGVGARPASAFAATPRSPRPTSAREPPGALGWRGGGSSDRARSSLVDPTQLAQRQQALEAVAHAAAQGFARAPPVKPPPADAEAARRKQAVAAVGARAREKVSTALTRDELEARAWSERNRKIAPHTTQISSPPPRHTPSDADVRMGARSDPALARGLSSGDAGLLDSKPKVPAPYDPATEKDTRPWRCQRCNTLQRPTSTVCVSCTKQRARNVANALSRKVGDP